MITRPGGDGARGAAADDAAGAAEDRGGRATEAALETVTEGAGEGAPAGDWQAARKAQARTTRRSTGAVYAARGLRGRSLRPDERNRGPGSDERPME